MFFCNTYAHPAREIGLAIIPEDFSRALIFSYLCTLYLSLYIVCYGIKAAQANMFF